MATTLGKRKSREDQHFEKGGHGSTLFVSNLPYDATSTDLKTAFSDLAPVRSAFVVLEHGTGVSKGVGYVSFAIREDAQSAFDSITSDGMTMNDRKLRVEWAGLKPKDRPIKDRPAKPKADSVKKEDDAAVKLPVSKSNDPLAIRTILISGLPSTIDLKTLWKKVRKLEGAENVVWPGKTSLGGEDPTTASALFSTSKNAQDAVNKLHAHVFKGSLLSVTLKKRLENLVQGSRKKPTKAALPSHASRLIVRNLPFDITEQDLRAIFLPYGPVHSINMPVMNADDADQGGRGEDTKPSTSNRSKGFAFVWMLSRKDAEAALKECNGMKVKAGMAHAIVSDKQKRKKDRREEKKHVQSVEEEAAEGVPETLGSSSKERMIVVDWALSKDRWEEAKSKLEEMGEDEGSGGDVEMKNSGSESEGDEDEDEEDSEDGDEHIGVHEEAEEDTDSQSEGEDEDEEPAGDDDESEAIKPKLPQTDVGTTLFIRNIPFTATEDELRTLFRAWGPLRYARITIDPETERSRGTGFVCFWNKGDADKVIEQSEILRAETMGNQPQPTKNPFTLPSILTPDPSSSIARNLVLHGRTLDAARAVTRDQAAKLKEEGEKAREKADKRNLYLLREGAVLLNTPAAETLPPAEVERRTNSFNSRRALLRSNPLLYVSRTRLSIRRIPLFVTERVLKRLAVYAVKAFNAEVKAQLREGLDPDELTEPAEGVLGADQHEDKSSKSRKHDKKFGRPTPVKQAKIVRQQDRVDPITGIGRSRGYGFIEMHKHADALRVLRWANNNPEVGAFFDKWWREELADLSKKEKAKESPDEARIKRMTDALENPSKPPNGTLIVEFSIENVQVVQRRSSRQKEKAERPRTQRDSTKMEEPPSKKRRISIEHVEVKKEEPSKPGKLIGSLIGRKRRARKAGK
ncbi:hypothetical protein BKA82DRAFT_996638 [Pisolithus tinctorius]|uniref:RRM domain-containing protein n=1 Tax=Pisolithus tinctorius Marx 270 TaxID=870435 RepID=A0A0C3PLX2_PISTI|nr:hypothetical protein BKA82DRAFT_996638 [Pisolithus tinctorius]KIO09771.1 hypothetical protein M404DRAFT_996638 [Pisolithus tinctorius Marx 270]